jgi:nucleolar protein 4
LKEHFAKFGPINDIKLLRRPDGKLIGCGFVEFEKREDAKTALEECSGKPLMSKIHTQNVIQR